MMFSEIVQKEAQEMREEGIEKNRIETAKNMFELSLTPAQIAKCTGLPLEQVLELQKELMAMPAN